MLSRQRTASVAICVLASCAMWTGCTPAPSTTGVAPAPELARETEAASDLDYAQTYVNLGHEFYYADRYAEAIDQYKLALAMNPYDDEAHASIGMSQYRLGRREQAQVSFRRAIRFNPRNLIARNGMALVTEDHASRAEQLEAAIVVDPDQPELRNNLCYSYAQSGDYDRAVRECREAIRLDSTNAHAHYNLGYGYQRQGRLDRALVEYRTTLRLRPGWARVINNMGLIYYYKSQFGLAINHYEDALATDSREPTFYYNLALAYEAAASRLQALRSRNEPVPSTYGMDTDTDWRALYRRAADQLRVYLRISPDARDAPRVRVKINELRRRAT